MRLSARVDYAIRAVIELATIEPVVAGKPPGEFPITSERIAKAQEIPPKFLESILLQLRRGGVVNAQRGPEGGYWLARPAAQISLAEVIEIIDGPLSQVRGHIPADLDYQGPARTLQNVWVAVEAQERRMLEQVTFAHLASGQLPF
ncbi:Rrf2 family protein [Hamadaea flava]|uniref:RrF2 family transcriptional regulator n=1 Tax=Hamadaea flava TaxID=1742688 RepID=A0ABV8LUX0_9ACTN|nr:Rrf2 family transcriptional regulator [Hamadaea flava]MCP2328040.1 Rrf2 family protein [Hamadaea flava]